MAGNQHSEEGFGKEFPALLHTCHQFVSRNDARQGPAGFMVSISAQARIPGEIALVETPEVSNFWIQQAVKMADVCSRAN